MGMGAAGVGEEGMVAGEGLEVVGEGTGVALGGEAVMVEGGSRFLTHSGFTFLRRPGGLRIGSVAFRCNYAVGIRSNRTI